MRLPRFSVAWLMLLISVIAADCAWLRFMIRRGRSMFGFDAPGLDLGVIPMASVIALTLIVTATRRDRDNRFAIAFMAFGIAAVLLYSLCTWVSPNSTRVLLSPIYLIRRLFGSGRSTESLVISGTFYLLTMQVSLALVGARLVVWFVPRSVAGTVAA